RALLDEAPAVDLHADTPLLRPLGWKLGERHRPLLRRHSWFGHVDLPRMAEGGLWGQFFGLVTFPFFGRIAERCHARIDWLARQGGRYPGLLHCSRTEARSPAWGYGGDDARGLTPFGLELVEACEAAGVILDLAHVNRRGFFDAVERARGPIVVSHTGVAGV